MTCSVHYSADIEVLHEREDWQVQSEEGGIVTSLPVLFENVVVETLLALKEIVIVKQADEGEGVASEVHSRDNKELRDNTIGHFQGLWEVSFLLQPFFQLCYIARLDYVVPVTFCSISSVRLTTLPFTGRRRSIKS